MDYPLDWISPLTKFGNFQKLYIIYEFTDSLTQTLVVFLSRKIVGWAMQTEYFQINALGVVDK